MEMKFVKGQRFLKWTERERETDSGPGYSCFLRIDPKGHIIYWNREFGRKKSTGTEYHYRFLSDVVDVRKGKHAVLKQKNSADMFLNCLMTIVLDIELTDPEFHTFMTSPDMSSTIDDWADIIFNLAQSARRKQRCVFSYMERLLAPIQYANCIGLITVEQIVKAVVPSTSNTSDANRIRQALKTLKIFNEFEEYKGEKLTAEHIHEIYFAIAPREEINQIFLRRTRDMKTRSPSGAMSIEGIERFINVVQRDPRQNEVVFPFATREDIKNKFKKISKKEKYITAREFVHYLISDENVEITDYSLEFCEEKMHEPLSSYYINSSHNSYLIGSQIGHAKLFFSKRHSSANVEIYRHLLLNGCRCLEIDCWDGPDNEPVVTHGPTEITLILPVQLKDVCDAIMECAFKTSVYPVCLSIENHCSTNQQIRMSEIFLKSFGDYLLTEPIASHPLESGILLPSPYKLKKKIIIKANKKRAYQSGSASVTTNVSSQLGRDASTDSELYLSLQTSSSSIITHTSDLQKFQRNTEALSAMAHNNSNDEDIEKVSNQSQDVLNLSESNYCDIETAAEMVAETCKYTKEFACLINYLEARPSSEFKLRSRDDDHHYYIYSLPEKKAIDIVAMAYSSVAKYTTKKLMRIYPDCSRINSSNYMPLFGWMVGVQMMALNFQTNSIGLQMNKVLFEENGMCGYVLKPAILRDPSVDIDIFGDTIHGSVIPNRLEIKVLSGQLLTLACVNKATISTYVQVDFYGMPLEQIKGKFKTKIVYDNGINPQYGTVKDEPIVIEKIMFPERSILRIRVISDRGDQIAHRLLPIHLLTNGYRHIILRNNNDKSIGPASIFVHLRISNYASSSYKALQDAFAAPLKNEIKQEAIKQNLADPLNSQVEDISDRSDEVFSEDELLNDVKSFLKSKKKKCKGFMKRFNKRP